MVKLSIMSSYFVFEWGESMDNKIIREAANKIIGMEYGDVIMHSEIAEMIGADYRTKGYYTAMRKIHKICLENSKFLESVHKIGYRIVIPDDYSKNARNQIEKGVKRIIVAEAIMAYAPLDEMSVIARQRHLEQADHIRRLSAYMTAGSVEVNLLSKPAKTNNPQNSPIRINKGVV